MGRPRPIDLDRVGEWCRSIHDQLDADAVEDSERPIAVLHPDGTSATMVSSTVLSMPPATEA